MNWENLIKIFFNKGYLWGVFALIFIIIFNSRYGQVTRDFIMAKTKNNNIIEKNFTINYIILIGFFSFVGCIIYYLLHNMNITTLSPNYTPSSNEQWILAVTDSAINRIYNILTITTIFFTVLIVPLGLFQFFKIKELDKYKTEMDKYKSEIDTYKTDFDNLVGKTNTVIDEKLKHFEKFFNADFYYSVQNYEGAEKYINYIIEYNTNNKIDIPVMTYYKLANCYYNIGDHEENVEKINKAIEIINKHVKLKYAKNTLGLCYYFKGYFEENIEKTLENYQNALSNFSKYTDSCDILMKKANIYSVKAENAENNDDSLEFYKVSLSLLEQIHSEVFSYGFQKSEIQHNVKLSMASRYLQNGDKSEIALQFYKYAINDRDLDEIVDISLFKYILDKYIEECGKGENIPDLLIDIGYLLEECFIDFDISCYNLEVQETLRQSMEFYENENI